MSFWDSHLYIWVGLPLLVFFARVIDVTLGTLRIIFISRGKKYLAPLLGFVEVFIWIAVVAQIVRGVNDLVTYLAYAAGFAVGNFVGMYIEDRLAIGTQVIRIIIPNGAEALTDHLHQAGYGVTQVDGRGRQRPGEADLYRGQAKRFTHRIIPDPPNTPTRFPIYRGCTLYRGGSFPGTGKPSRGNLFWQKIKINVSSITQWTNLSGRRMMKTQSNIKTISLITVTALLVIAFYAPTRGGVATTTQAHFVYLPLVVKHFPLIPVSPQLNAISNEDGDGSYTVSWSSSEGADTYTLQEDDNIDFSSPSTAYSGYGVSTAISGRDVGTYYYRVQAANAYASSEWSNVEAVTVTVVLPDCPLAGAWRGVTSQGAMYDISFEVENLPQCQIAAESLRIEFRDNCSSNRTTVFDASIPIANNQFEVEGAGTQVIGDFTSSSTTSGTFSYSAAGCIASGTWTAAYNYGADYWVSALALQSDDKIVVGGQFSWLGGQHRSYIGRLNPGGSLDTAFNPGANSWVLALAVQEDGKILVGGSFTKLGGQTRNYIGRLNADGSLDTTFNPGISGTVNALAVEEDGQIVVGGEFTNVAGQTRYYIARLDSDGTLDASFNPGSYCLNCSVDALALQEDGMIVVGGTFHQLGGATHNYIGRLNPDGTIDTSFNPGANLSINTLAVQEDGKIVVGGAFTTLGGQPRNYIGRLNLDGTIDADFNPGADNSPFVLVVQDDGKIVAGGQFDMLGGEAHDSIGRLNADGSLDIYFNPSSFPVYAMVIQGDGKIVVGGQFTTMSGEKHYYIARLNPDGTIDASFLP